MASSEVQASWRRPRRRRPRRLLLCELLEDRALLAGDLIITNAQLVDNQNNPIAAPTVGERMYVRASWTAAGLTASDSYRVRFVVDGVTIHSSTHQGQNGTFFWNWYLGGWYATGALQSVTVTIDGDNTVAETNESNNSLSFTFTAAPVSQLTQKFVWPVAGEQARDWTVVNYVDVDPTSAFRDFRGNQAVYNGHDALDISLANFAAMDRGLAVYAAADGVVVGQHDGEFDRHTSWLTPSPPANYVILEHPNGYRTQYWHFRRNSIVVNVGDVVVQGQQLGEVGSSGVSTGAHLHFAVYRNGRNVETYYAPDQYWLNPVPYVFDADPHVMDFGVSNHDMGPYIGERPSVNTEYRSEATRAETRAWMIVGSLTPGDELSWRWVRPNGTTYANPPLTNTIDRRWSWWWWRVDPPSFPAIGEWRVEFYVNGNLEGTFPFQMTATGGPEIRAFQGATYIIDGRTTPIDFGSVDAGQPGPTRAFTIENHGYTNLVVNDVVPPTGFSVVATPAAPIPPGGTATVTLQLDAVLGGHKEGYVEIHSNDADESVFRFAVMGDVVGSLGGVVDRRVLYNHSAFDGDDPLAGPSDDNALAPDKAALLPGQAATFAHYTSYARGLNGLVIDLAGVPGAAVLTAADFEFRQGDTADPAGWSAAPPPSSISLRRGAGLNGADRVTLLWPDGAIRNAWLETRVRATPQTGLTADDVFYFGNLVGDTGDSPTAAQVNAIDFVAVRDHPRNVLSPTDLLDVHDLNRDRLVNAIDLLLLRDAPLNGGGSLPLLDLASFAFAPAATLDDAPGGAAGDEDHDDHDHEDEHHESPEQLAARITAWLAEHWMTPAEEVAGIPEAGGGELHLLEWPLDEHGHHHGDDVDEEFEHFGRGGAVAFEVGLLALGDEVKFSPQALAAEPLADAGEVDFVAFLRAADRQAAIVAESRVRSAAMPVSSVARPAAAAIDGLAADLAHAADDTWELALAPLAGPFSGD